eukprot:4968093-Pleurochrysis_carterae.AAC.1
MVVSHSAIWRELRQAGHGNRPVNSPLLFHSSLLALSFARLLPLVLFPSTLPPPLALSLSRLLSHLYACSFILAFVPG